MRLVSGTLMSPSHEFTDVHHKRGGGDTFQECHNRSELSKDNRVTHQLTGMVLHATEVACIQLLCKLHAFHPHIEIYQAFGRRGH